MTANFQVQRWIKFFIGGGINTVFTYGIYLLLMSFIHYQIAYLIAYVVGIIFSYWFNATIVFKVVLSWKSLFFYPIVYIVQYIMSAFLLVIFVETIEIDKFFAPLIVIFLMIPITYILSRYILLFSPPTH